MKSFKGGTAVITGAASGFGLETARLAAQRGMNVVMADVQQDALDRAAAEVAALGAVVLPYRLDVAKAAEVEALGAATLARFGAPHIVFNNAGVGAGGLIWENTVADWEWVIGVNVMGVAHGIRVFTPMMLGAAEKDPAYEGHIVNTASMAGLLSPPNMGVYNVSKHAVVTMSETLYQDLRLVTEQIGASVLCPFFVPTGITESQALAAGQPTRSQLIGKAMSERAVGHGKVSAADVAGFVFDAIGAGRFYIYSHPNALASVQTRLEDVVQARNPTDPFAGKPEIGAELRAALRAR
jgi:NAD(P)-dependent dehydrogenase (short-subunit alcohol dehydrogenase family)